MRLVIALLLNALFSHPSRVLWAFLRLWFSAFGCDLTPSGPHPGSDEVPLVMFSGASPLALREMRVNELGIVHVVLVPACSLAASNP